MSSVSLTHFSKMLALAYKSAVASLWQVWRGGLITDMMEHDDMTSYLKVTQGQTRVCIPAHIIVDCCSCPYCPVRHVQGDGGNECW